MPINILQKRYYRILVGQRCIYIDCILDNILPETDTHKVLCPLKPRTPLSVVLDCSLGNS